MKYRPVTPRDPCPACGRGDWCARLPDGGLRCERTDRPPHGYELVRRVGGGAIFAPVGSRPQRNGQDRQPASEPARLDWRREAERCAAAMTAEKLADLSAALGLPAAALSVLGCGWSTADDLRAWRAGFAGDGEQPDGAYIFPERDGRGSIVGLSLRAADGRKGSPSGSAGARRGLIIPANLRQLPGPILIVEGASDTAACGALGIAAVGRPSNTGGASELAELLRDEAVLIVGENDAKDGGAWPGRDGARSVAMKLAAAWNVENYYALPPPEAKDIREWLRAKLAAGLNVADAAAVAAAREELLAALRAAAKLAKPEKQAQADRLVALALERYRLGLAADGEAFAVKRDGPNIALMLRGSRDALRASLARDYREACGKTPAASALADAMNLLAGIAADSDPEAVHLRVAPHEGGLCIDLGTADGAAVIVDSSGWRVVDSSPVLFRRTALTSALPMPERGGDVAELRELLNVSDASWPLVLGWLVAALLPDIPRPILLLSAEQGTGKSTTTRFLVSCVDPSVALTRMQPRDLEQWAVAAAGSMAVALDNVSSISDWFSDALCRACTGDALVKRTLYADSDVTVLHFRRVVVLNSIDAGSLRGDLGERLLVVDLERIPPERRRAEKELDALFAERHGRIFGALLDLLAGVLAKLPDVHLDQLERMADFCNVLAAMDQHTGMDSLSAFRAQRGDIARRVVDDDALATALATLARAGGWEGTAAELFTKLTPQPSPRGWPADGAALGKRLKRLTPSLRTIGVDVEVGRSGERRWITVRLASDGNGAGDGKASAAPGCCHPEPQGKDAGSVSSDGSDGIFPPTSEEVIEL